MTRQHARPHTAVRSPHAPGFSLMEILVVLSLIGLLIALIGGGYLKLRERAQNRTTVTGLQQMLNVAEAYRVQTKNDIRNDNRDPETLTSIQWFVKKARQLPEVEKVLVTLNDRLIMGTDGSGNTVPVSVVDAWNTPLIYRNTDDTGALPDDIEAVLDANPDALETHRRPYFISAGPDGSFTEADDNIYSFNLD